MAAFDVSVTRVPKKISNNVTLRGPQSSLFRYSRVTWDASIHMSFAKLGKGSGIHLCRGLFFDQVISLQTEDVLAWILTNISRHILGKKPPVLKYSCPMKKNLHLNFISLTNRKPYYIPWITGFMGCVILNQIT